MPYLSIESVLEVKNKLRRFSQLLSYVLLAVQTHGQWTDMLAVYHSEDELVSFQLFESDGGFLTRVQDPYAARAEELVEGHSELTVTGDFTGDGLDEIACFGDLFYKPNLNPQFTKSVVWVLRSAGNRMIPVGTWYSILDSVLDLNLVDFAVAADYNQDGKDDIALFYNDPDSEEQTIYVLESTGSGFSEAKIYFSTIRTMFNFTTLRFACPGDINGNGKPDIAVFYNYFGQAPDTRQSVFLFESDGTSFVLIPDLYNGIKQEFDFSSMNLAQPGDYNADGITDIAVLMEDSLKLNHLIAVFEGSVTNKITPENYFTASDSIIAFSNVKHFIGGEFAGDISADLALFYDNPLNAAQEILILEGEPSGFKSPLRHFQANSEEFSFSLIETMHGGSFVHQPQVSAATWKENKRGAVTFTFDDGYQGAFEHGAAALDEAGLKATFYIFTDTIDIYSAPLASTELIREYRNKGI